MSNIQRRLKNVEVVSSFKNRNSAFDIFNSVPRISYLTFDYLPGTLYYSNPYLVLRTWYLVHGTWYFVTNLIRLKWLWREAKHKNEECEPTQNLSLGIHWSAARHFRVSYTHHPSK